MKIYIVEYPTGYDYSVQCAYFISEETAKVAAAKLEKENPGMGFYVTDVETED